MDDLFYQLKNKNIGKEKIIEILAKATKYDSDIKKIKLYNINLCTFSYIYDVENLFLFLAENFHEEFSEELRNAVIFTYTNKNPVILNIALKFLKQQTEKQKNELLDLFANNCYRLENINIIEAWLQKELSTEQQEIFVNKLFQNNNRPFLNQISKIKFWKPFIQKYNKIPTDPYYIRLLNEPLTNDNSIKVKNELEIFTLIKSSIDNSTTENIEPNIDIKPERIVRKKKRVVTNIS